MSHNVTFSRHWERAPRWASHAVVKLADDSKASTASASIFMNHQRRGLVKGGINISKFCSFVWQICPLDVALNMTIVFIHTSSLIRRWWASHGMSERLRLCISPTHTIPMQCKPNLQKRGAHPKDTVLFKSDQIFVLAERGPARQHGCGLSFHSSHVSNPFSWSGRINQQFDNCEARDAQHTMHRQINQNMPNTESAPRNAGHLAPHLGYLMMHTACERIVHMFSGFNLEAATFQRDQAYCLTQVFSFP